MPSKEQDQRTNFESYAPNGVKKNPLPRQLYFFHSRSSWRKSLKITSVHLMWREGEATSEAVIEMEIHSNKWTLELYFVLNNLYCKWSAYLKVWWVGYRGKTVTDFFLIISLSSLFIQPFGRRSYTQGRTGSGGAEPSKDTAHVSNGFSSAFFSLWTLSFSEHLDLKLAELLLGGQKPRCHKYWFVYKGKRNSIFSLIKKATCTYAVTLTITPCTTHIGMMVEHTSELRGNKGLVTITRTYLHMISSYFPLWNSAYTLKQTHVLFSLICTLFLSLELPLLPVCSLECPFFSIYFFKQKSEENFFTHRTHGIF